ncbi:hypothetical protein [Yersinia frederiksenii]|jgi:hypothetical protein|uniref:hypothetical protein n=1 Tax=Yersinia frederiksenii TaxID=29484 RepID=UPI00092F4661|nr:hypothetical protein [Yersinia frederiksenii]
MNIKKIVVVLISNIVCAVGSTLTIVGVLSSIWFFFLSNSDNRFYWGGGASLLAILGYLIFRITYPNIQRKWDDYY